MNEHWYDELLDARYRVQNLEVAHQALTNALKRSEIDAKAWKQSYCSLLTDWNEAREEKEFWKNTNLLKGSELVDVRLELNETQKALRTVTEELQRVKQQLADCETRRDEYRDLWMTSAALHHSFSLIATDR